MNVPDLISPIVGYRAWRFYPTESGCLVALNGDFWWPHQQKSVAYCRFPQWVELDGEEIYRHSFPQENCSCGLYAAKDFNQLQEMRYMDDTMDRVWGEVNLWGKVIEHDKGYRAQFAYPRKLIVPYKGFPFLLLDIEKRVESFAKYGVPLYFKDKLDQFLLWHPETGIHNIGQLVDMKQKSFVKPKIPDLVPGTRVWMHFPKHYAFVQGMSKTKIVLRSSTEVFYVALEDMSWDEANSRWVVYTPHYFVRGLYK